MKKEAAENYLKDKYPQYESSTSKEDLLEAFIAGIDWMENELWYNEKDLEIDMNK